MHLVNLTPHAIRILCEGAEELVLPPDGRVARVATRQWNSNKPGRKLTRLRRNREMVP